MCSHLSRPCVTVRLKRHSDRCAAAEIRSTKYETKRKILSTKYEIRNKFKCSKIKILDGSFRFEFIIWNFEIVSNFDIRI